MSNDTTVPDVNVAKISKKDKKSKKNKDVAVDSSAAPVVDSGKKKEKKEKKDKKRKAEADADADAEVEGASTADPSLLTKSDGDKKQKKKKQKTLPVAESAGGVEVVVADAVGNTSSAMQVDEPETVVASGEKKEKKSKKEKKEKKSKKSSSSNVNDNDVPGEGTSSSSVTPANLTAALASTADSKAYLEKHNITLTPDIYNILLNFSTLPINPALRPYLASFTDPTPIQACSWPPLFQGKDVVGIAETGSGKTLSFGLPGLNVLSTTSSPVDAKGKGRDAGKIRLLVVAPTRELATQTYTTLLALGKLVGIGAVCLYGGVGKDEQIRELRKKETAIVVGTPGRVMDLADSGDVDFSGVQYLVLDEADRMLDQGFENDIRKIIGFCPKKEAGRQTVMFSATWPESVRRLASTFLTEPIKITVGSDELSANKRIQQNVEVMDTSREKDPRLLHHLRTFMKNHPKDSPLPARILVFALYKKEATRLEYTIRNAGYKVAGLHGDLSQDARFKALDAFKEGKVNVLVATDVAARGLDIPDVQLVINVTFPLTTEDFVHRCGRTGRAGKEGKAITFFTGEAHERSLAGEFMRVLRDAGAEIPEGMNRFPSTIKKKEHGSYGAFYRDISDAPKAKKITFD